jgi:hypothetical protein
MTARHKKASDAFFGRRAALLLEVVVALAVLVAAIGLLGAQLAGGLDMTLHAEEELRATLLADRIVALVQMDPELQRRMAESEDLEDEFGKELPGYYWRLHIEPVDREHPDELKLVVIEVLYQSDPQLQESTAGISSATVLRRLALFKGKAGTLNLVEQAGLTDEQAEELRQSIPIPGFDPTSVDLQQLMSMFTTDEIMQLLPMLGPLLQQIAGGNVSTDLAGLAGQFGEQLATGSLQGMSTEDLAGAIRQAVQSGTPTGGMRSPAPAPPRSPAGAPASPTGGRTPPRNPAPTGGNRGTTPPGGQSGGMNIGPGSGPGGEYTLEDLMRLRDAYERSQGGGK